MELTRPYDISKRAVCNGYLAVKRNRGAAGVDKQSLEDFDRNLANNLYKLWNRMASGSYYPPPVKVVEIPKPNGGIRRLGVPTVSDRIAQAVVKQRLEPEVEPYFRRLIRISTKQISIRCHRENTSKMLALPLCVGI